MLEGEAGIGKTTLWSAAAERARERGFHVAVVRAAAAETQLAFGAIGDLIEPVRGRVLDVLPEPQRHALAIALLLESSDEPPDARALGLALVTALRELCREQPLVVAADDVQWMDPPSAALLAFAARRLAAEPVVWLVTLRAEPGAPVPFELDRALAPERLRRLRLGPLSIGALASLLRERLGVTFTRPVLRRLEQTSGGNPFFALELAGALNERAGSIDTTGDLPVPHNLRMLVSDRFDRLPAATRESLVAAAQAADPTLQLLEHALGRDPALGPALDARIVEVDAGHVRFTHPLLAATLVDEAAPAYLRTVHARLAAVVSDPERRARHLVAAADGPDERVAAEVEQAAVQARRRGAPSTAGELAEQALKLTPEGDTAGRARRAAAAGSYFSDAGMAERAQQFLREAVALSLPGRERAYALLELVDTAHSLRVAEKAELAERAVAEGAGDDLVLARAELVRMWLAHFRRDFQTALAHGRTALAHALLAGEHHRVLEAHGAVARYEAVLAEGDPDATLDTALRYERELGLAESRWTPLIEYANVLTWRDELDRARELMTHRLEWTIDTGDDQIRCVVLNALASIEQRAGDWQRAQAYANEAVEVATHAGFDQNGAHALLARGKTAALLGDLERGRSLLEEAKLLAADFGDEWVEIHSAVALGALEVSAGHYTEAAGAVEGLSDRLDAIGIREPGYVPFESDAIEALVALGRLDEAEKLIERLAQLGLPLDRPRTLAAAARGRGLLLGARGDPAAAIAAFDEALGLLERLQDPFERGRTLLARGTVERRARQRANARASLEQAREIFAELGAGAWVARANAELGRLGGRTTSPTELTTTERQVAELVAQGLTNKETAAALFVSVRAVEANLTRIYSKLGIRSRAELAGLRG